MLHAGRDEQYDAGCLEKALPSPLKLVPACRDGLGPSDFYDMLKSASTPKDVLENPRSQFKLGFQKAARLVALQTHSEIWALTKLDATVLKDVNILRFGTCGSLWTRHRRWHEVSWWFCQRARSPFP